jgi:hypothetical protein
MFIKTNISASIRGFVDHHNNIQALLKAIDEQFKTSDKALSRTLIMKFLPMKLITVKGVREHIMRIGNIAPRLKTLEIDISEFFLVHYILITLPLPFEPFIISYNTHKDKWSTNELLTMCVQEQERLVMEMNEVVIMTTVGNNMVMKINQSHLFVMSLIWLMLIITHGGLILVLQSMF